MVKKAEDVFKDALALNADEREQLVKLLIDQSAGGWATPEIEQAWKDEVERRVEVLDRGEAELIPAEEVFRRLDDSFAK